MWQIWVACILFWMVTTSYAAYLFGRHAGSANKPVHIAWYWSFLWPLALFIAWVIFVYRVGYSEGED